MVLGVHKKVIALLELCRQNGITLNPEKFCISQKIELGGFEISSSQENPAPMIRPTKLSVNKLLEFKEPQDKKSVQRFLGSSILFAIGVINSTLIYQILDH